jgi:hypothetical protein
MTEGEQPDQVFINAQQAQDLFKQFHEWYRIYLDQNGAHTDKAFELNKQIASIYERLLLIDVGTIGLSITAFVTLAGKFSPSAPRHVFVWLIGTAWGLMFVSAMLFSAAIIHVTSANSILFKKWRVLLGTYHMQMLTTSLIRLSKALSGSIRVGEEDFDAKGLFAKFAAEIQEALKTAEAERAKVVDDTSNVSQVGRMARMATITMQLGFVLLCIAAIKAFLAV